MLAVDHDGLSLRSVAGDGDLMFASFASPGGQRGSAIEARRGAAVTWSVATSGDAAQLVSAGTQVVAAISGSGSVATGTYGVAIDLRGTPAAILIGIAKRNGTIQWHTPVDSTEWALVTSMAAAGDDFVVGGSFAGTLRIGTSVVSSAGASDGFVARLHPDGKLAWLVRMGGAGADTIQGVAVTGTRIAIAGTFSPTAELRGVELTPIDEKLAYSDGFAGELDGNGGRKWTATFGNRADDAVVGVAIDGSGHVVVAASAHDVISVGSAQHTARGGSDGLVIWYDKGGDVSASALLGGSDVDELRGIAAVGDHVVVGGVFSGSITLAGEPYSAGGGDDAFLAALDAGGTVRNAWHVGGAGREEIADVSAFPGGIIAGVAHTADLTVDDEMLRAPADPASGAALVVRGL